METEQWILAVINIIGGIAVLGSYALGIRRHPDTKGKVWGGVPSKLKPYYTISMLLAAVGYLAFAYFVFFKIEPNEVETMGGLDFPAFYTICAVILIPSALWMPLTFSMIDGPSKTKWCGIRTVLGLVGVASLVLLASLITLDQHQSDAPYWIAVIGIGFFCIQTALLDALVWPVYFPYKP